MKKITVLGAGLVGSAIVRDLALNHKVTAVDNNPIALGPLSQLPHVNTIQANALDDEVFRTLARNSDLLIGALPGYLGYQSVKLAIENHLDMVDISFFPENPFQLDRLAKDKGVTVVTDCGVAPGMGNLILGFHNATMKIDHFRCYVGGLPSRREWPWQYKAVFSPRDVIEEYTRPARYRVNGQDVVREALSDPEMLWFEETGTLEAFNSDGLRSLLTTMKIPNMIEKTLRYPGTIDYLRVLRHAGFFSEESIKVGNVSVRPLDLTAELLFPQWKLADNEEEFTIMRIEIEGFEEGERIEYRYDLYDRFDAEQGITSMARTTGYTCTAVAQLMADASLHQPGVNPPELIGSNPLYFNYVLSYLKERKVDYRRTKISK